MPLEWWPSGKPKPSILTLPQEIVDQILEDLYLKIAETSLTVGYARKKFTLWQFETAILAFGVEECQRWMRPWLDFDAVRDWYSDKMHITSAFSLLPQEIIDEIAERHYLNLLEGSLYTGPAYVRIVQWSSNIAAKAFGQVEAERWQKELSYYPILTEAFNTRARNDNMQYH